MNSSNPLIKSNNKSKGIAACYELAEVLVTAVLFIAVLFLFVARFAGVEGSSMVPTLHDNDWLAVTAYIANPRPGQIVIISPRTNAFHEPLVKRVIAVGGDVVDIRDDGVYVNGGLLKESYLPEGTVTESYSRFESGHAYPITVPPGKLFVMGDNRGGSSDSRFSAVGFVREDDILGRVCFRLNPFYARDPEFHFTVRIK